MCELPRPAVFLDRDGTINVPTAPHQYITRAEDFKLLPGAVEGLVDLARHGFPLVVVSNQRGVDRGIVPVETLAEIESALQERLREHGCAIAAFYYCLHGLQDRCDCRKPRPGLLLTAAGELGLDLGRSWMIGDSPSDVEAAHAAGAKAIFLTRSPSVGDSDAELTAPDLAAAAAAIRLQLARATRESNPNATGLR
jgi:D-glycero-D-manno-heptose 1,7-bisphosphate phosphatase